jgi:hypothetical protein
MKFFKKSFAALPLCAFALNCLADPPTSTVVPRNAIMTTTGTNTAGVVTLVTTNGIIGVNSWTNIILTMAYQHEMSVTTIITPTNAVPFGTNTVGSTANWTNFFDLGKIINTPSNGTNNYTTNWSTTSPIQEIGTFNNLSTVVQPFVLNHTNFDGYELIRLTKIASGAANNYGFEVILGQTP